MNLFWLDSRVITNRHVVLLWKLPVIARQHLLRSVPCGKNRRTRIEEGSILESSTPQPATLYHSPYRLRKCLHAPNTGLPSRVVEWVGVDLLPTNRLILVLHPIQIRSSPLPAAPRSPSILYPSQQPTTTGSGGKHSPWTKLAIFTTIALYIMSPNEDDVIRY